jgi:hypothetical protein
MTMGAGCVGGAAGNDVEALKIWLIPKIAASIVPMIVIIVAKV